MNRAQQAYQRRLEGATIEEIMAEFGWTRSSACSLISRGKHWGEWAIKHSHASRAGLPARNRMICDDIRGGKSHRMVAEANQLSIQSIKLICRNAGIKPPNRPGRPALDSSLPPQICDLAGV